jgi:hypothetical protein
LSIFFSFPSFFSSIVSLRDEIAGEGDFFHSCKGVQRVSFCPLGKRIKEQEQEQTSEALGDKNLSFLSTLLCVFQGDCYRSLLACFALLELLSSSAPERGTEKLGFYKLIIATRAK